MTQNESNHLAENDLRGGEFVTREGRRTKYLIFTLAEDRYAVPLNQVKEVIGMAEITAVPHVPSFFKGLINLRGKIISVIDLREKLSLKTKSQEACRNCIIISEIGDLVLGAIVDDVCAVFGYQENQIERQVNIQSKISSEYIMGVAKSTDQPLTLLLDLSRLLNVGEIKLLKSGRRNERQNENGNEQGSNEQRENIAA
ncbi:MAG: purine-binding chemotaxis protein CheW [Oligoflexia bacterium]|nr:purine-binding chemotaxis protein CheW [Oligoflexia bacterium]